MSARVILVRHGATEATEKGVIHGLGSEVSALTPLGMVQARKTAEFLMDAPIACVMHSGYVIWNYRTLPLRAFAYLRRNKKNFLS